MLSAIKHAIRERNVIQSEMNRSLVAYLHSAKRRGLLHEAFPIRRLFRLMQRKLLGRKSRPE